MLIQKWYDVYKKLAQKLYEIKSSPYPTKREKLYKLCFGNEDFKNNNKWIEKFDEWNVKSLDPIHIFASINGNSLSKKNRIKRINILFKILDTSFKGEYKNIDFTGCPTPVITNIIGARDEQDQEEIWEYFDNIIQYSQDTKIDFLKVKNWYGINISSFTIFLFWIDAKNFLPLDKNTLYLLERFKKDFKFPNNYKEYKQLLPQKNTNLYINLALIAYDEKTEKNLSKKDKNEIKNYFNNIETIKSKPPTEDVIYKEKNLNLAYKPNFKLISIKPLTGCSKNYLKTLKENEYYIFDKTYNFDNKNEITLNKNDNISLYNTKDLKININAIVGKNGTGKSTIMELLFAFIYNLSIKKNILKDCKRIDNINLEIIYESDFLYRIVSKNNKFEFYKYKSIDLDNKIIYKEIEKLDDKFDITNFFYTIGVNYSQHSLNNMTLGEWIKKLFHKNDSYQIPIVIEPYRENGNIDINKQEDLVKQRLLANLLLQENRDNSLNSFRQLTEFYKAEKLKISFNKEKFNEKYKKYLEIIDINNIDQINKVYKIFEVNNPKHNLKQYIEKYILIKLIKIAKTYSHYSKYFNTNTQKFNKFEEYLNKLKNDNSHITYKLKQAINFLKYYKKLQPFFNNGNKIDIEILSNKIEDIKRNNNDEIIHRYLPPSIFDIDIILENDIPFSTLSSGEKQKIYSVNSILYHINNINSIEENENLLKYRYINIILDEIELYFHPELQRTYLNYLHNSILKTNTNYILGINIIFITHSPFILSDIPDNKILFLKKDTDTQKEEIKTFGANIHELLINGFFMKNSIGEFALKKIQEIIEFHNNILKIDEEDKNKLEKIKKNYSNKKDEFYFIKKHLGEEYIAGIIKNHLEDIEKRLNSKDFKQKRIKELEEELEKLKKDLKDTND